MVNFFLIHQGMFTRVFTPVDLVNWKVFVKKGFYKLMDY